MKKLIIALLIFLPLKSFACANAHIFKIFPVGMLGDTIVTIDIDIYRGMNGMVIPSDSIFGEKPVENTFLIEDDYPSEIGWFLKSYITKYDKHQKTIDIIPIDSISLAKGECDKELELMYKRAFDKIINSETQIKKFQPKSISFCQGEYKCDGVKVKKNTVEYKNVKYPIEILNDSTYYGFDPDYFYPEDPSIPPINSVRKYVCDKTELVVIHAQMGQYFGKYDFPKIKFDNIETAVYEEPIFHHGNGYDLFIVTSKKK